MSVACNQCKNFYERSEQREYYKNSYVFWTRPHEGPYCRTKKIKRKEALAIVMWEEALNRNWNAIREILDKVEGKPKGSGVNVEGDLVGNKLVIGWEDEDK